MDNISANLSYLAERNHMLTEKQYLFKVAVRGYLYYIIQVIATFFNVCTIVVISKYKALQITSNALVVCFSLGNSLAVINGNLTILSDFIIDMQSQTWKYVCTALNFFLLLQQFINVLTIMAISFERVYSIYFPIDSYRCNTFKKMTKVFSCYFDPCLLYGNNGGSFRFRLRKL